MASLEARFREGLAAHTAGQLDRAEAIYRELLNASPGLAPAVENLVVLLRSQGRWTEAEDQQREALRLRPDDADLAFRLAQSLLASGRYSEGWPLYEARYAQSRRGLERTPIVLPSLSFPQWTGAPVRSLLVWGEQGLGDQIQFARYLPLLAAKGISVTLVCDPRLVRLFERLDVELIAAEGQVRLPRHDAWVMLGSLPLHFRTTLETIPTASWLAGGSGRSGIGLATRGRPEHFNDAARSLPAGMAVELLGLPKVRSLHPEDTGARDFAYTAAIVRELRLVITVDTSVAHLAGSMGIPVWIMLPARATDWRWLRQRNDSPWYPTARLFRQQTPGDWATVIQRVKQALAEAGLV